MTMIDRLSGLYSHIVGKHDGGSDANGTPALANMKIRIGQCTSIGNFRDNNEDRLFSDPNNHLFIVADGMGGQAAGEQASQIAIDVIPQLLKNLPQETEERTEIHRAVSQAVVAANDAIVAQGIADPTTQNMGTTVVLALLRANKLYIANIGDSRAYILRENRIKTITKDHNLAEALYEAGTISKEELKTHRFRHVLYKYLGSHEAKTGPDLNEMQLQPGDRVLLATDGLTGVLDEKSIGTEVYQHDDPQKCADSLVQLALDKGSKDNVTCIVLFVDAAEKS